MNQCKFDNKIVPKPWGYEYLLYSNDNVGIWYLNINYNERTSLHAHPNKKTGLIILSGVAKVSFLNHSFTLTPPDKTMIRHGVFHSTKAKSKCGLEVLEIETPVDKEDLIRLEDYYGREGTPYEDSSSYIDGTDIRLLYKEILQLGDCELTITDGLCHNDFHTSIILNGGIISHNNYPVVSYGDIVDNETCIRLANKFNVLDNTQIVGVNY